MNSDDPRRDTDGNRILGMPPKLRDSEINFKGKNNILYCEPGVILTGSVLDFNADNSVIYLGTNRNPYNLSVLVHNDTVFYMGIHNYINNGMTVILSEQKHCLIGDYCILSRGIFIRNADPHLIYDCKTKDRINQTKSVFIGDHVWVGQDSMILKGTQIDSGSIIGGGTVISGKKVPHNTIWAGNPARQVKSGVFWDQACVHTWREDMTRDTLNYDDYIEKFHSEYHSDGWVYEYIEGEALPYARIDSDLGRLKSSQEKCDYLINLRQNKTKNRFVHSS